MHRLVLILAPLALVGCGAATAASEPRVSVTVHAPGTVRADSVQVQGIVSPPNASVQVNGANARVSGGKFTATVSLQSGANLIDVTADAPGRRADADAVNVMRDARVEIPDLAGAVPADAESQLSDLGLDPKEQKGGGFLDDLLPGDLQVCATQPDAGTLVDPHTTVTVVVAKSC